MQERIPILQIEDLLLVSIQVDMHDRLALQLQDDLTEKIYATNARGVLIDISALEVVDSFIGRVHRQYLGDRARARCQDGGRGHAARRGDHARRTRTDTRGRSHRSQCFAWHGAVTAHRGGAMIVAKSATVPVTTEGDVVKVRQTVRALAVEIKLSLVDQTKVVTAASELGRNLLVYGGGGEVRLDIVRDGARNGLRVIFEDRGPGIPDVEQALKDGFTTGTGLGLGLGGARRLVNDFNVVSNAAEGTRVTITKWR